MIDELELRRDEFTVRVDSFAQSGLHSWRIKLEILLLEYVLIETGFKEPTDRKKGLPGPKVVMFTLTPFNAPLRSTE